MKEAGLVCVLQVGRGWLRELVSMFEDSMQKQGVKRQDSGQEGTGGGVSPTPSKYLLNKEEERQREDATRLRCTAYTIIKWPYLCLSCHKCLLS